MMRALLSMAIAAAAPSPDPTQQFDLICTGTTTTVTLGGETAVKYVRRLRIDLPANQWCTEDCQSIEAIARVDPNRLVLLDINHDTPRAYWVSRESVNRVTGEHSKMWSNDPHGPLPRSEWAVGTCEKAPFSGFLSQPRRF